MTRLALAIVVALSSLARADNEACFAAADAGQSLRDQGKYAQARDQFAACAATGCPAIVQRDCSRWLDDVMQAWPTIVASAEDGAGADTAEVRVLVDGVAIATRLDGTPLRIEPGEHALRFETPGAAAVEQKLVVHVGEKNRLVHVRFAAAIAPRHDERAPGAPVLAWSATGVAVVALATAGYFGLTALSRYDDLKSGCAKTLPGDCSQADVDAVNHRVIASDIALGAGVAAAAVATYLFVRRHTATLQPAITLEPSGASAGVRGTF